MGHVLFDGAVDALLVNGQQMEVVGVLKPGSGVSEGVIDGVDAGSVFRVLGEAEGESASLNGASALQAPAVVGDGLDDIALEVANGGEAFEDDFAVLFVGLLFFGSEDAELAGEAVTPGIEPATPLAFGSLGAGGAVGTLGGGLRVGHSFSFLQSSSNKNGPLLSSGPVEGRFASPD